MATGGAGKIFPFTTNGNIKTGDGMALAYRAGVALKDMEFVQYHPTGLPGTGILITEATRGEGGYVINNEGERFLATRDYGVGTKAELGPRDMISRAIIQEIEAGRGNLGPLRRVRPPRPPASRRGEDRRALADGAGDLEDLHRRRPRSRADSDSPGGSLHDGRNRYRHHRGHLASGPLRGGRGRVGFAQRFESAGFEFAHRMPRLRRFGGTQRAVLCEGLERRIRGRVATSGRGEAARIVALRGKQKGGEKLSRIRADLHQTMESGCGVYRVQETMDETARTVAQLKGRYADIALEDSSTVFNTELVAALEMGNMLDVARGRRQLGRCAQRISRRPHPPRCAEPRRPELPLPHPLPFRSGRTPAREEGCDAGSLGTRGAQVLDERRSTEKDFRDHPLRPRSGRSSAQAVLRDPGPIRIGRFSTRSTSSRTRSTRRFRIAGRVGWRCAAAAG